MSLGQIKDEFVQGIKASEEAQRQLSQDEIFQRGLKNSRNRHQHSLTSISSTLPTMDSISTIQTPSSTTQAQPDK